MPPKKTTAEGKAKAKSSAKAKAEAKSSSKRKRDEMAYTEILRGQSSKCRGSWKEFKSDSPMTVYIKSCLRKLTAQDRSSLADTLDFLEGELMVASACSGSEVARVAFDDLARLLGCKVVTAFTCEKEPWKREWIRNVVEPCVGDENGCCFTDIELLSGRHAFCERHGKNCDIPKCFVWSAGFSCKSLSKLYAKCRPMGNCLQNEEGSSGKTFRGLRTYVRSHRPRVLVLENVEELIDGDGSNYDTLQVALREMNYEVALY